MSKLYKLYDKIGVYILALGVILLNISLAFDNVVWGDEAYSQMAIRNCNLYGIYERVYYWDSHPPFYYYYLRLFADLFGYKTPVYHIASLVPFVIGIVLAVTLVKKHMGSMAASFFVILSGLSQSCVEYNLEIRMYSLVFMCVLLCGYSAYEIVAGGKSKAGMWICMVIFGLLGAYTHYFGLLICGLIILFTGITHYILHRGKTWVNGLISIVAYVVIYIPWLFVLFKQTQSELNDSWMTEPESFGKIVSFICGGDKLKFIICPFILVMSLMIYLIESGALSCEKTESGKKFKWNKPSAKGLSKEMVAILMMWCVIVVLLGFSYGVSLAFHPILAFRYTYVIIPVIILIMCLCLQKLVGYIEASDKKVIYQGVMLGVMLLALALGLFDFKYFRSVSKTEDVQTAIVLETVGTPAEDAVLCSNGVKHLAWTVLSYYYPDNEVTLKNPNDLDSEPSEIWAFMGYQFEDDLLEDMEAMGYKMEAYPGPMMIGKYGIFLYKFYK